MGAALDAEEQIHAISEQLSKKEYEFAAKVIEGEHSVDTAGIDDPAWGKRQQPEALQSPVMFTFEDYKTCAVRHSGAPARLARRIGQVSKVHTTGPAA